MNNFSFPSKPRLTEETAAKKWLKFILAFQCKIGFHFIRKLSNAILLFVTYTACNLPTALFIIQTT